MTEPRFKMPPLTRSKVLVIMSVAAVLFVLGVAGLLRRPAAARPTEPIANDVPQDRPSPIADSLDPPRPKHETAPLSKESSKPIPEEQRARAAGEYNSKDTATDWAVIAATLNGREAAERRAQSLKNQW